MTIEEAKKLAIGNGWEGRGFANISKSEFEMVLDPNFWQCLGKVVGWEDSELFDNDGNIQIWKLEWHNFIDHLADGKSAEDYFKSL